MVTNDPPGYALHRWSGGGLVTHFDTAQPRETLARFDETMQPLVRGLSAEQPLTIVAHPLALPEADLCRAVRPDVRIAAVYLAPSNIATVHDPLLIGPVQIARWVPHAVRRWLWRQIGARLIDPVVLPDMNAQRSAQGLPPIASLLRFMREAPDLSLTLFPEWFGHRQLDWPQPLVCGDFTLYDPDPHAAFSPELTAFLEGGSAPLVFTHGTGNIQSQTFFAAALKTLDTLGRRAIFLCSERTLLPAVLPATVLWQPYLPFSALLPHAAALVHHGGIGTTAEALRAGVPQLIVPLAFDQFDNGARIAAMHAGLVLHHRRLSATKLASSLHRLTSCAVIKDACRTIRTRMQADSTLAPVVAALSDLARRAGKN